MNKILELIKKYKELIVYGIFGVLTTIVDFGTYYVLTNVIGAEENLSNVLSQITAIVFAFITNKIFVFEDRKNGFIDVVMQFTKFFSMRLVSLLINSGLFWIMVEKLSVNDFVTKASVAVIVIILNYVFSKLFIFKKD